MPNFPVKHKMTAIGTGGLITHHRARRGQRALGVVDPALLSHHPVLGPGVAAAQFEFLELGGGRQVDGPGVVGGVDAIQQGDMSGSA